MKRKNKNRAEREAYRVASDEMKVPPGGAGAAGPFPGLMSIEIGVPYSRRFEPPYVSGHTVAEGEEEEEDYDICQ